MRGPKERLAILVAISLRPVVLPALMAAWSFRSLSAFSFAVAGSRPICHFSHFIPDSWPGPEKIDFTCGFVRAYALLKKPGREATVGSEAEPAVCLMDDIDSLYYRKIEVQSKGENDD